MPNIVNIALTNTFEEWRVKDNEMGTALGDLSKLNLGNESGDESVILALNALRIDANNNTGWIGTIGTLYGGNIDLTTAVNANRTSIDIHTTEIGTITDLYDYADPTTPLIDVVVTVNSLDSRVTQSETDIGTIGDIDATLTATDLVDAVNTNKDFIDQISLASGISLTTTFGDVYNGSQTSVSGALNNDYARLNVINNLIGGTQSNGTTIAFAAADLYGTHTSLVAAINGIEDFVLTNSKWDGPDNKSLIWALNNHESRLDTEENNIDLLQGDVGTWSGYTGSEANITAALNGIKTIQNDLAADYVNVTGDTMSGSLVANGGIGATSSLTLGVASGTAITINNQQRVGIGVAAHSSYKVDVNGTINATALKVGGTTLTEVVQDIVGGMVTGNTESGIGVVYQDGDGTLDFNVSDPTITLTGDVTGSATMTNLGNVSITTAVGNDSHTHAWNNIISKPSTFTPTTENVQDIVGTMVANPNTEDGITVSYDDGAGKLNFNVSDPTITLTGAVTGAGTITNLGSVSIATTAGSSSIPVGSITNLLEYIQDTVGAMVSGNTEVGIAVTYQDGDGTLDFDNGLNIYDVNGTQVF
jgi:hypothetical protein